MDLTRDVLSREEKGQAIMVIDDDTQVLKFVSRMLGAMGYGPVYQATGADEALKIWSEHGEKINLVVSDFVMPQVSGDHLALRMIHDKPQLKVLFISGNNPASLESAIPLVSGRNFLQKPFTVRDIQQTVETLSEPVVSA